MVEKFNPPDEPMKGSEASPEDKKRLMEQAQEEAAHERETEGGYQ
jgi:hypothetical protein